jgi:hypothetical protein
MDKSDLISQYMLNQNELFHKKRTDYGYFGSKWAKGLRNVITKNNILNVLDYGAGKRSLEKELSNIVNIKSYDPAIYDISDEPEPAELVTCTHVLEHIEPVLLENILQHIYMLSTKMVFISVDSGPSNKILPDGRDSNLIQQEIAWWKDRIGKYFDITNYDRRSFIQKGILIKTDVKNKGTFLGKKKI